MEGLSISFFYIPHSYSLTSFLPLNPPLDHSAAATVASLLFLKYTKHTWALEPYPRPFALAVSLACDALPPISTYTLIFFKYLHES